MNETGQFSQALLDFIMLSFLEVEFVLSISNTSILQQGESELQKYIESVNSTFLINDFFMDAG